MVYHILLQDGQVACNGTRIKVLQNETSIKEQELVEVEQMELDEIDEVKEDYRRGKRKLDEMDGIDDIPPKYMQKAKKPNTSTDAQMNLSEEARFQLEFRTARGNNISASAFNLYSAPSLFHI
eukprot:TRINITY_DN2179_c0_g1_i2.p1 TRINITY_DN2179_c0_g1~~TRINITY_DN2179_c0_g1_i2.p1  ORF type:complete len:123 (+),score=31.06 TRINITY_DN2179_c0_g1_i2:44-412(+)